MRNPNSSKLRSALSGLGSCNQTDPTGVNKVYQELILSDGAYLDFCSKFLRRFDELLNKHDVGLDQLSQKTALSLFVSLYAEEIIGGDQ